VVSFDDLPGEFSRVRIPARRYAVFPHSDHISRIRATVYTIWNKWLPASGYRHADAADFELYDDRFDPRSGMRSLDDQVVQIVDDVIAD
jgi:AraC family transcriptional regulator